MAGVAQEQFRGFAYRKDAGTWRVPRAIRNIQFAFNEEAIERDHQLNSFGDYYAPDPGAQAVDGGFETDIHADTFTEMGDLLEGGIGELETASVLTFNGAGTNDATQFAFSAGTPAAFARIEVSGTVYYVPVDLTNAGQAMLGVELPTGAVPDAVNNPSECQGGVYNQLLGDSAQIYEFEVDRRGRPNEVVYNSDLMGVYDGQFMYERRKRLAFGWKMKGGKFTRPTPPSSNITDTGKMSIPFIAFEGDILLKPASPTPALDDGFTPIKKISFRFVPDLLEETGSKGLDGGSSLAGSDVLAYTRMALRVEVRITLTYPDSALYAAWEAGTPYKLYAQHIPGKPAGSSVPVNRFLYYFPRLVQAAKPQEVADGGAIAQETVWLAERDTTRDWDSLFHFGFINAAPA